MRNGASKRGGWGEGAIVSAAWPRGHDALTFRSLNLVKPSTFFALLLSIFGSLSSMGLTICAREGAEGPGVRGGER